MGLYEPPLKELIKAIKYQRHRAYARAFGRILAEAIPYVPPETLIMPVPTATTRVRLRGFDQAALIAEAFAHQRSLPFVKALVRVSQSDQIGQQRAMRIKQMANSYRLALSPAHLKNRSILLIDDVITTGATLEAAAKLLRENGALHIDAAVVARHLRS